MTLKQRVEELERRVKELEARPVYVPIYIPPQAPAPYQPHWPNYPWITCGGAVGVGTGMATTGGTAPFTYTQ